jgi:hypothetical protein
MKFKAFAAASLLGLSVLPLANAQMNEEGFDGNIPFEFHVGHTVLPAGNYMVRRISLSSGSSYILSIRGSNQATRKIMFSSIPAEAQSVQRTKLTFHRYGNSYFLSAVWPGFGPKGYQLPPSKAERAIAVEMAAAAKQQNPKLASVGFTRR